MTIVPQSTDTPTLSARCVLGTAQPYDGEVFDNLIGRVLAEVEVTIDLHAEHARTPYADDNIVTRRHTLEVAYIDETGCEHTKGAVIDLTFPGVIPMLRRALDLAEADIVRRAPRRAQEAVRLSAGFHVGGLDLEDWRRPDTIFGPAIWKISDTEHVTVDHDPENDGGFVVSHVQTKEGYSSRVVHRTADLEDAVTTAVTVRDDAKATDAPAGA